MTYTPNIPQPDPSPAIQQPDLKTNFSQFPSIFSSTSGGVVYNHTPFNTANQGKHEAILMQDVVTDPIITNDYVALYNKGGQIFARIPQFLPDGKLNTPMQLTYSTVNTAGPQYQSFLAGGYIVYIGSTTNIANSITVSPTPTLLLIAQASVHTLTVSGTPEPPDVATVITQPDKFLIKSTNAPAGAFFTWFAIGLQ